MTTPKQQAAILRLRALVAAKRSGANSTNSPVSPNETKEVPREVPNNIHKAPDISVSDVDSFPYNANQQRAINLARTGKSFVLTGAAGTGKTTTVKGIVRALLTSGHALPMEGVHHKHLPISGAPSIIIVGFTNKAVENVRASLSKDLQHNCLTIHKALEYEPTYEPVMDKNTGKTHTSMRFMPARTEATPMPEQITTVIVEEASMVAVDLWNRLIEALPARTHSTLQVIFIGDIQQLPPVFGKSIFIHAMSRGMTTVELDEVYRTALESPILNLAHRILSGKQIPAKELQDFSVDKSATGQGKVFIHVRKHKLSDMAAVKQMSLWLPKQMDKGAYNPEEDIILTPFNVNFGTIALNNIVAGHLAKTLDAPVYEIYTGVSKVYFRIGERVLYNKSEAVITDIKTNPSYYGKKPRAPSNTMDYKGIEHDQAKYANSVVMATGITGNETDEQSILDSAAYVDNMLSAMSDHTDEDSPTARAASHIISVQPVGLDVIQKVSTSGDINNLGLGYALTIHKSQGSEYRRVFFITHASQNSMLFRELIYTGITRAREELYVICEPDMFVRGINTQRYPGKTIAEKIAAFDRAQKLVLNNGRGNIDQLPKDLHRFIERAAATSAVPGDVEVVSITETTTQEVA